MSYTRTTWVNDSTPAIDATNLNNIETGLVDAHADLARRMPATAMALEDLTSPGTFLAICRADGTIYSGSSPARAIQTALDRVSNHDDSNTWRGGTVLIGAGQWALDAPIFARPSTAVWTSSASDTFAVHVRGEGALRTAPHGGRSSGGTHLMWNSTSSPGLTDAMGTDLTGTGYTVSGAVLNASNDAHGWRFEDLVIAGAADSDDTRRATYAAASAGRGVEWWRCQFRRATSDGLLITNGSDSTGDRYVQQRIMFCRSEANGSGYRVEELGAGSGCTDGRIYDVQVNSCDTYGVKLVEGGWQVTGGHLTGGGDGTAANMIIDNACFVSDVFFDVNAGGPCLDINNNNVFISNCRLWSNGRNGIALVQAGGSKGVFLSNCVVLGGNADTASYIMTCTSASNWMVNCGGPTSYVSAITDNATTSNCSTWT